MRLLVTVAFALLSTFSFGQNKKPSRSPVCWTLDKKKTAFDTLRRAGLIDNYFLWDPGTEIKVGFPGNTNTKLQERILNYAKTWEQYANIKFTLADPSGSDIRVSLGDEANYTYIGTYAKIIPEGEPTMWIDTFYISRPKEFRAVVMHEFGHVLGLMHEHKHLSANIKWDKEKIFNSIPRICFGNTDEQERLENYWMDFLTQAHSFYTNGTPYDGKSIMHYAIPASYTLDGVGTDWNYELSEGDKTIIGRFYPMRGLRHDSDEVFRIDAAVKKVTLQDKPGEGYLVHSDVELVAKKEGEIYFAVIFYDSEGYPIEDDDGNYCVGSSVAAVEKLNMTRGQAIKGALDIMIPYDQLKMPEGTTTVFMEARVYHFSAGTDEYKLMYTSAPVKAKVPAKKTKPAAMLPARAPAQPASRILNVAAVEQRTLVWCWLAVGEMLFRYYGVPSVNRYDYQCGIIGLIYQPCRTNCTSRQCIIPSGSNFGTLHMLRQYPRLAASRTFNYSEGREMSMQSVVNNINAGRPIVCGISPAQRRYDRDAEHAVMITGYDIGPNGYYLVVNDPYPYPQGQNPYYRNNGRSYSSNKYLISYSDFTLGMCWNWSVSNIRL